MAAGDAAFTREWDDAPAGTVDPSDVRSRQAWFVQGRTKGVGASWHWTNDGTSSGLGSYWADQPMAVVVMMMSPTDRNGYTLVGAGGPIVDPSAGSGASEVFFWRTERVSAFKWKTTVFNGGADEDGYVSAAGLGRIFFAFGLGI